MAERWEWVDAAGQAHQFDMLQWRIPNRGGPTGTVDMRPFPHQSGAQVLNVRHNPAQVILEWYITAGSAVELRQATQDWAHYLSTPRGFGLLRVIHGDGTRWELPCIPEAFYAPDTRGDNDLSAQRCVASLVAPDPYWRTTADTVITFTNQQTTLEILNAGTYQVVEGDAVDIDLDASESSNRSWFPFGLPGPDLDPSDIFTSEAVQVDGTVDAQPMWVITGPASTLKLINDTTGKALEYDVAIGPGRVVTVETGGATPGVYDDQGVSLLGDLTSRDLWALKPGANQVRIELGAVTNATSVRLSFRNRREAA